MDTLTCDPGYHVECTCVPDRPPDPTWHDLGQVPAIAASPTALGRTIAQLHPFGGRIYLGYGDWNSTLQPGCDLIAYDPQAGAFVTVAHIATDALWSLRTIEGRLWALATDPEVGADPDALVVDADGSVSSVSGGLSPYPWHLFDACEFGGTMFLAGGLRTQTAKDGVRDASWACVWRRDRRPDGVAVWTQIVLDKSTWRCYAVFPLNGSLWAICGNGKVFRSDDGKAWIDTGLSGPSTATKPMAYGDGVVFRNGWPATGTGMLGSFDGRLLIATEMIRDHFVDDAGSLWELSGKSIKRDVVSICPAPLNATALCVLDGVIYVGSSDSHLWRYA